MSLYPEFKYPGRTGREKPCYVQCECGHKSYGDYFLNVWSGDSRDAWWQHRLHMDSECPEKRSRRADLRREQRLESALTEIRKILERVV